jgi:hypothetical protein
MLSDFYDSKSTDNIGDTREGLEYDDHDDESYMPSGQGRYLLNLSLQ